MATLEENYKRFGRPTKIPAFESLTGDSKDDALEHHLKIEQITLAQEQRAALSDQERYTKIIKQATVWMAIATAVVALAMIVQIIISLSKP